MASSIGIGRLPAGREGVGAVKSFESGSTDKRVPEHPSAQSGGVPNWTPGAITARVLRSGVMLCAFAVLCPRALAQWTTQTLKLNPGFNPVYLQVTPPDTSIDSVFGAFPGITEVWMYNRYLRTTTFTTNSTESAAGQDHWITWYPGKSNKAFLRTLAQVRGGQSYLVKVAAGSAPLSVPIVGMPAIPRSDWIPNDVVLAGFPIQESGKVSFHQFLKDTPQLAAIPGQDSGIFTINPQTAFETRIRNPELTTIVPGRAYWAYLEGHSHNPYPFEAAGTGEGGAVQFPQDNPFSTIVLKNGITTAGQTVRLRLLSSDAAPAGRPANAGTAPVAALVTAANGTYSVQRLNDGLAVTLVAGETRSLRLGLLLQELPLVGGTNSTYQAFIEVTEPVHGYRQLVPVVAEVPGSRLLNRTGSLVGSARPAGARPATDATVAATSLNSGLWVGNLTLNAVNRPVFSGSSNPDPALYPPVAAAPLNARVMIHVDSNGVSRLVQQVVFAEVSNGSNRVTRMFASPATLPAGAIIRSRISAPSWPSVAPVSLAGYFGTTITGVVNLAFNDRVNPFVHRYHPDHNNLAEDFVTPLASGGESPDISRRVVFYFGDTIQTGAGTYAPSVPALKFGGVAGEYASTTPFTTTLGLTIQFWLNVPTLVQNGATLVAMTNASRSSSIVIGFRTNTGTLGVTVRNASGTVGTAATTAAVPVGEWANVTVAFDSGGLAVIYLNGLPAANQYVPAFDSGAWDALWVGNLPGGQGISPVGSIHDVVVRSGTVGQGVVPQLMVVPQVLNTSYPIVVNLQGDAVANRLVNRGSSSSTVTLSNPALIDLSSAPAVPLWTYGTTQGTYVETITGLRRQAITVQGSFQFTRVNQDSALY